MIRLFEMFAGYGGASFALEKAGIPFECVGVSEIDKYAMQCYSQNHKGYHYGDCTKIDPDDLPDFDLLTGGFPCQSFSVAGKGLGEQDTRGTLFNEIIRIAEVKQPKYMLLENVKGLMSKKHKGTFDKILSELERIGYNVTWKVLNSKEHGIPQNRERIWFVCLRDDKDYLSFNFPEKEELNLFLKDILEDEVDEKYFLSDKMVNGLLNHNVNHNKKKTGFIWKTRDVNSYASTLRSNASFCPTDNSIVQVKRLGGLYDKDGRTHQDGSIFDVNGCSPCISSTNADKIIQLNNPTHSNNRVYSHNGCSPALNTMQGGNRQPFILNPLQISSTQKHNTITRSGINNCLPSAMGMGGGHTPMVESDLRIRKLTPRECFRLMGFLDDGIDLEGLSNTQRYKLAGNGWDVNLVSKIFRCMFV